MIEVQITQEMRDEAQRKADEMGLLRNSITKGKGSVVGFLGELATISILGSGARWINTFDYDLVVGDVTVDVKSKSCLFRPLPEYEVSVAAYNIKQKTDYYIFVRIQSDLTKGWILGKKRKDLYFAQARFCKEGDLDVNSSLGWKFKANCYNMQIKDLSPIKVNKFH